MLFRRILAHLTAWLAVVILIQYFNEALDWGWTTPRLSGLFLLWEPHTTLEGMLDFARGARPPWPWGVSNIPHFLMLGVMLPAILGETVRAVYRLYRHLPSRRWGALNLGTAYVVWFLGDRLSMVPLPVWGRALIGLIPVIGLLAVIDFTTSSPIRTQRAK